MKNKKQKESSVEKLNKNVIIPLFLVRGKCKK